MELVLMEGAWSDKPHKYNSINDFLDEKKKSIETDINNFIKQYYNGKLVFELNDTIKEHIAKYVEQHSANAYPNADGSFDSCRFNCLIDSAIDSYLYSIGFYK